MRGNEKPIVNFLWRASCAAVCWAALFCAAGCGDDTPLHSNQVLDSGGVTTLATTGTGGLGGAGGAGGTGGTGGQPASGNGGAVASEAGTPVDVSVGRADLAVADLPASNQDAVTGAEAAEAQAIDANLQATDSREDTVGVIDSTQVNPIDLVTDYDTTGSGPCAGVTVRTLVQTVCPYCLFDDGPLVVLDSGTVYMDGPPRVSKAVGLVFRHGDGFRIVITDTSTGGGSMTYTYYYYYETDATCAPVQAGAYGYNHGCCGERLWEYPPESGTYVCSKQPWGDGAAIPPTSCLVP